MTYPYHDRPSEKAALWASLFRMRAAGGKRKKVAEQRCMHIASLFAWLRDEENLIQRLPQLEPTQNTRVCGLSRCSLGA